MRFTSLFSSSATLFVKDTKMQLFGGCTLQTYKKILQFIKLLSGIAEKFIWCVTLEHTYGMNNAIGVALFLKSIGHRDHMKDNVFVVVHTSCFLPLMTSKNE